MFLSRTVHHVGHHIFHQTGASQGDVRPSTPILKINDHEAERQKDNSDHLAIGTTVNMIVLEMSIDV